MNNLKEDVLFNYEEEQISAVLEKFFDNVLNCITVSDFETLIG